MKRPADTLAPLNFFASSKSKRICASSALKAEKLAQLPKDGSIDRNSDFDTKFQNRAVLLLMVVYILNYLDRSILNILAEPIKMDLGLKDWQLGLLSGLAFSLFYSVLGVPIARYAERADRPKLIAVAMTIWCGATALTGAVQNFTQMVVARVFVGVGEAGCTPPAHSLISDYVPPEKRASALSLYSLGVPLGMLIGLALGGFLADILGWRLAFVVVGVPGLIVAAIVVLYLREPRRSLKASTPQAAKHEPLLSALRRLMSIPTLRWAALGAAIISLPGMGFISFLGSFYFRAHGEALSALADSFGMEPLTFLGLCLGGAIGLTGAVGTLAGGFLADKWRKSGNLKAGLLVPCLSSLVTFPVFVFAFLVDDLVVSLGAITVASIGATMYLGPLYASAHSVVPKTSRATASALILLMINLIGLTFGPVLIGIFSDYFNAGLGLGSANGLRWSLILISGFIVIGSAMFWWASLTLESDSQE